MASASLPLVNGDFIFRSPHSFLSNHRHSAPPYNWGWTRDQEMSMAINTTGGQAFRIFSNPKVSSARGASNKEVIMVDPSEAKRLAAKQMKEIKAKEKFKRRRQIEAINGAWAMIGLTAGLVIEGQTGKSFLTQLAEYWSTIVSFFCDRGWKLGGLVAKFLKEDYRRLKQPLLLPNNEVRNMYLKAAGKAFPSNDVKSKAVVHA